MVLILYDVTIADKTTVQLDKPPPAKMSKEDSMFRDAKNKSCQDPLGASYQGTKSHSNPLESQSPEQPKTKKKSSPEKNMIDDPEDSWETLYSDEGDCINTEIQQKLNDLHLNVKAKHTNNHSSCHTKEPKMKEDEYAHVIEIYDFPVSFKTQDLKMIFKDLQNTEFDIKWIDETHALGIFSTAISGKPRYQFVLFLRFLLLCSLLKEFQSIILGYRRQTPPSHACLK